jgi:hypothetical protein
MWESTHYFPCKLTAGSGNLSASLWFCFFEVAANDPMVLSGRSVLPPPLVL